MNTFFQHLSIQEKEKEKEKETDTQGRYGQKATPYVPRYIKTTRENTNKPYDNWNVVVDFKLDRRDEEKMKHFISVYKGLMPSVVFDNDFTFIPSGFHEMKGVSIVTTTNPDTKDGRRDYMITVKGKASSPSDSMTILNIQTKLEIFLEYHVRLFERGAFLMDKNLLFDFSDEIEVYITLTKI